MNTTLSHSDPDPAPSSETRLRRLERTNARWRTLAIAGITGGAGLLIGGMASASAQTAPLGPKDYTYIATDDTIYRMDPQGRFEYIKFDNGRRSANGFFGWGPVQIDPSYKNPPRPQP